MRRYAIGEVTSKIADKGSRQTWLVYLLVGILIMGIYFLLPPTTQNVFSVLVGLSAVGAIVVGVWAHHSTRPLHWYVLALGLF